MGVPRNRHVRDSAAIRAISGRPPVASLPTEARPAPLSFERTAAPLALARRPRYAIAANLRTEYLGPARPHPGVALRDRIPTADALLPHPEATLAQQGTILLIQQRQ